MRKYIIILMIGILLINLVSAFDWEDGTLVSYWDLNEGTGSNADDSVANNDGTLIGSPQWVTYGKLGNAINFTGGGDYVNVTTATGLNLTNFTVAVWVNVTDFGGAGQWIVSKANGDGSIRNFEIYTDSGSTIYVGFDNSSLTQENIPSTVLVPNKWYFIVEAYDTSTRNLSIYVNGLVNNSKIAAAYPDTTSWYPVTFGKRTDNAGAFSGLIDEIGIWNRRLTASEILDLYNSGSGSTYLEGINITVNTPLTPSANTLNPVYFNISSLATIGSLQNISLFIDDIRNESATITGTSNESIFEKTLTIGDHNYSIEVCNDADTCVSSATYDLTINYFTENSFTYNATTTEFSPESFAINITYNKTTYLSSSANLIYNGTRYLGTKTSDSGSVVFTRSLTVPITPAGANNTFYWEILLSNSTSTIKSNSTFYNQTVNPILLGLCNATLYAPVIINYTIFDENTLLPLNATMDATFMYTIGNSSSYKNYSLDSGVSNTTYKFCSNTNETLNVDIVMELNASGYNNRIYSFGDISFDNVTNEQSLFMLNSSYGTNIIIEVTDQGLKPLEDYVVEIYRYYPSINNYKLVKSDKTDEFGEIVARLIENEVKYRFNFINPLGTTVKSTNDVVIACRSTYCVVPFVIEDSEDDYLRFRNVTDFAYSLSYSNSTNAFTLTWNDVTGELTSIRLLVEKIMFNGTTIICNDSLSTISDTLTCVVGSDTANYRVQAFRNGIRFAEANQKVNDLSSTFGLEGLIWSFFLLFTLIAVGLYNPPLAVILYLGGFIAVGALGLIPFSLGIFFANLVIGALFIWAFRG